MTLATMSRNSTILAEISIYDKTKVTKIMIGIYSRPKLTDIAISNTPSPAINVSMSLLSTAAERTVSFDKDASPTAANAAASAAYSAEQRGR